MTPSDNNLGARGISALAPKIGDLTRLEELYLNSKYVVGVLGVSGGGSVRSEWRRECWE